MATAPRENIILLDVGFPWMVAGCWNPADEQWVYASPQVSMCDGEHDWYFETEREALPKAWLPMPEITRD